MQVNIGCGPFRAPSPWVNLDVVRIDGHIEPDIVVPSIWPETWGLTGATKVYMGHVLEHIQWELVPDFLRQVLDICVPGAEIAIVGPDIRKFVAKWKHGQLSWDDVMGALENHTSFQPAGEWDGARHQWNCYEQRVLDVAVHAGVGAVEAVPVNGSSLGAWPVTSYVDTQCCVLGIKLS
jgi:hypothetical protein